MLQVPVWRCLQRGLAAAARSIYVCKIDGCLALVDAGRARAGNALVPLLHTARPHFQYGDGCASHRCTKRFSEQEGSRPDSWQWRQLSMMARAFCGGLATAGRPPPGRPRKIRNPATAGTMEGANLPV